MMWQAASLRIRQGWSALRARITRKRLLLAAAAGLGLGTLAIGTDALWRGRIPDPQDRIPSLVYARPAAWGGGQTGMPVPVGPVPGAPAELRTPVPLHDLPDHLAQAVLAVEDQRFYQHDGIDVVRIGGALIANLRAGRIAQGGSTITQQLSKNLFLSARRTPLRKIREAAFATILELRHDKGVILEAYLNEIYLGQDGGRALHGVGAASHFYFGKSADRLSLAESALLAGMIRAPNRYHPIRHPEAARARRDLVLRLMTEQGRTDPEVAERARRSRLPRRVHPVPQLDARYFQDAAMASIRGSLPPRGAAVFTTLDPSLQRAAVRAVRDGLGRLSAPEAQAALVALDPQTGEILALVGGRDYARSQFNRATGARRQPGSAFKPIVALAALGRDGRREPAFTLASRVEDAPLTVRSGGLDWQPTNYDGSFRGEVTVREALEQSLNVPVARLGMAIGAERLVSTARRLGITSPLRAVPSLALGSSEVTLLELTRAYGVLASGGRLAETRYILHRGRVGAPVTGGPPPEPAQVADPAEVYLVTSALEGVVTRGTGRALEASRRFGGIAGKTGTSNDWRDAWFLVYTPSLVVGVWVGYDDGRSLGFSGARAALPIVSRFLDRATPDDRRARFPVPEGIETARISTAAGTWWGGWECGEWEVFLEGTAPEGHCLGGRLTDWIGDRVRGGDWNDDRLRRAERALTRYFERLLDRARDGDQR